ncbi:MAG: ROK family transcriptional regulator [Candidatus Marinimicrobia bacterium]|nr:ROK family transcriptional regulator [Candidatus Neomarinimicrobiota bacterium]
MLDSKVNVHLIKELNESRVLKLIKKERMISRIELARKTNISKVAISEIVNRLINQGYVVEVGKGNSTKKGGKKPTLLKLNPENGYVVGLEIKSKKTRVAIANLNSEIVAEGEVSYELGSTIDDVIQSIFEEVDRLLAIRPQYRERLKGIGIGIPGFINYSKGELIYADTMRGWDNKPIASRFAERYGVPVFLENDVKAMALGEYLLGAGKGKDNIACIHIGEGVGAGIIVEGHLLRGDFGSAGEVGYLELGYCIHDRSFLRNLYTTQKYFGDILRDDHLLNTIKLQIRMSYNVKTDEVNELTLEDLISEGNQYWPVVQDILDEFAFLIALLCTDMIKIINTGLIILSGRTVETSVYLVEKVRELVKHSIFGIPFPYTHIVISELGRDGVLLGVIAMALQYVFDPLYFKRTPIKYLNLTNVV